MLLSNRTSALRLIALATCVTFCIIFFLNYRTWGIVNRTTWGSFRESLQKSPETTLTRPSAAPVTVTISHPPMTVTPTPVTVTITPSNTLTAAPTFVSNASTTSIPDKVWYKLGPKGLNEDTEQWINTCLKNNPSHRVEFLGDASSDAYVKDHFAHRPDVVETYLALPIPILKADFLRYLILYAEGGIWSDLDVSCLDIPIHDWIPAKYKNDVGLVVGLEFDIAWGDNKILRSQFASWMIMAKPGSRHMLMAIDDILERLHQKTKQLKIKISELKNDHIDDVVEMTGPKGMTRSVVKSLEMALNSRIDDRNISALVEPKLLHDVLIMPANSFAAMQNGFPENQGPRLIDHHYAGTWKNEKGGESP